MPESETESCGGHDVTMAKPNRTKLWELDKEAYFQKKIVCCYLRVCLKIMSITTNQFGKINNTEMTKEKIKKITNGTLAYSTFFYLAGVFE